MKRPKDKLTARQVRAIEALLSEPTMKAAAEKTGVSYPTLKRWLSQDTLFQNELERIKRESLNLAANRISASMWEAVLVVRAAMLGQGSPMPTRLRAAEIFLNKLLPLKDYEVEERVGNIEALLDSMARDEDDE